MNLMQRNGFLKEEITLYIFLPYVTYRFILDICLVNSYKNNLSQFNSSKFDEKPSTANPFTK